MALLPYYARLVATLGQCMKDVGSTLVSMVRSSPPPSTRDVDHKAKLEEEFNYLLKKKDQIMIETKLKVNSSLFAFFVP